MDLIKKCLPRPSVNITLKGLLSTSFDLHNGHNLLYLGRCQCGSMTQCNMTVATWSSSRLNFCVILLQVILGTTSTLDDGKNITYTSKEVNQPKQYISGLPSLQLSLRFKSQLTSTKRAVLATGYTVQLLQIHFSTLFVWLTMQLQILALKLSLPVTYGAPQGESWSLYVFVVYIDDLPTVVNHCSVSPYANDAVLYCYSSNIKDLENTLNEVLQRIALRLT